MSSEDGDKAGWKFLKTWARANTGRRNAVSGVKRAVSVERRGLSASIFPAGDGLLDGLLKTPRK